MKNMIKRNSLKMSHKINFDFNRKEISVTTTEFLLGIFNPNNDGSEQKDNLQKALEGNHLKIKTSTSLKKEERIVEAFKIVKTITKKNSTSLTMAKSEIKKILQNNTSLILIISTYFLNYKSF